MSDRNFGMWVGTAVNDTSSVVAAGYTFSDAAGNLAVIVKLTRTLMIVPVTLVLALYKTKKSAASGQINRGYKIAEVFPWFVIGFIIASIIYTFCNIPSLISTDLTYAGKFIIVMAMASIGLNTNIVGLLKNGKRPILLGSICWAVLALTSLLVQRALSI